MKWFAEVSKVYLYREAVDFRKSINGLSVLVEDEMGCNALDGSLYMFSNKKRDKLKVLHWDQTGFVLWYKRLESEKYSWPFKAKESVMMLDKERLYWLLSGMDILGIKRHKVLKDKIIQ